MLHFRLFGVPITVQPWFWLFSFFLASWPIGGIQNALNPGALLMVCLFVLVMFTSLLIHELGHALVGKAQGAAQSEIVLSGFGGYATFPGHRAFSRQQEFRMVLAGPLWQAVAGLAVAALLISLGNGWGKFLEVLPQILGAGKIPLLSPEPYFALGAVAAALSGQENAPLIWQALAVFIGISLYWPILNLIPVLPLDGGRLMANAMGSWDLRKPRLVSAIVGGLVGAVLLWEGSAFFGVLLLFLAFQNWQESQRL